MSRPAHVALTLLVAAGVTAWLVGGLLFWLVVTDPWAAMELVVGVAPAS